MNLILTNAKGQKLDLLNNRDKFVLFQAEALHGIETDISETESPYMDGVNIESVKALPRGIELTFKLTGEVKESIDFFTSVVKSKQYITLTEKTEDKEISIKGIATIPPYTRMSNFCEITLSIYCGQPYWQDVKMVIGAISSILDLLTFPSNGRGFTAIGIPFGLVDTSLEKTFDNDGDTSVGMTIYINARGEVKNPRLSCSTGTQNGWFMELGLTLHDGDEVEISTEKGNKYILVNGSSYYEAQPILNYLTFVGKDWLQLEIGENTFNIGASSGVDLLSFTINYKRKFE